MGFIAINQRNNIRSMCAEPNGTVWNATTWFHNEDIAFHMHDLRDIAQTLVNKYGEAFIDRVHIKRTVYEKKNGGPAICYAANAAKGGWRNIESIYNVRDARNLAARGGGTSTWFDTNRHWSWTEFDVDASANPWPASLLATDPLFLKEYFSSSGSRNVAVGGGNDNALTHIQVYIFRPGFPGWAGNIMSQNGKAVPGWASQLVAGNWLTSFVGGKQYLTSIKSKLEKLLFYLWVFLYVPPDGSTHPASDISTINV